MPKDTLSLHQFVSNVNSESSKTRTVFGLILGPNNFQIIFSCFIINLNSLKNSLTIHNLGTKTGCNLGCICLKFVRKIQPNQPFPYSSPVGLYGWKVVQNFCFLKYNKLSHDHVQLGTTLRTKTVVKSVVFLQKSFLNYNTTRFSL